jgi:hypothetical protein
MGVEVKRPTGSRSRLSARAALSLAIAIAATAGQDAVAATNAHGARVQGVSETVSLVVSSAHGSVLDSRGRMTGTYDGSVVLNQNIATASRATGIFTASVNGGGQLSGRSLSHYYLDGSISNFYGTMTITGGSGRFAHTTGAQMRVSGVYNRAVGRITLHLTGQISL